MDESDPISALLLGLGVGWGVEQVFKENTTGKDRERGTGGGGTSAALGSGLLKLQGYPAEHVAS